MAFNSRAGGKGSATRPAGVSMETFDSNFDRIFGKKKPVTNDQPVTIKLEGDLVKELHALSNIANCSTESLVEAALIQFVAEQKQLQEEMKKDNGGNTDIE